MEYINDNQNMSDDTKETNLIPEGQSSNDNDINTSDTSEREHGTGKVSNDDNINMSDTSETTRDDDTRRTSQYQSRYDGDRYSDEGSHYGRDHDRGMSYGGERRGHVRKFRKYDKIATRKLDINYKKPEILREFLTEQGKILSRQITGNSAQNQRRLVREVKRARYLGLLPSA